MADRPPPPPRPPSGSGDDAPTPDRYRWLYGQEAQDTASSDQTQVLPSTGGGPGPSGPAGVFLPTHAPRASVSSDRNHQHHYTLLSGLA